MTSFEPPAAPPPVDDGSGQLDDHHLGRLTVVDPRTVWANEAADFTPWLEQNVGLLTDTLGIDEIVSVQREVPVGPFFLDLLCEDTTGRRVVIENQLAPSDHTHMGQLLVYGAGLTAGVIIWIATRFRDEYRRVLEWLNEHTDPDVAFFGVEVRVVRIATSPPAPVFDVIVQPNEWGKAQKQQAAAPSRVGALRQEFFRRVMEQVADRLPSFRVPKPSGSQNWLSFKSGAFGAYSVVFARDGLRVEAYLDSGHMAANKALFDELHADRIGLEDQFGAPLTWERIDDRRASRIAIYREGGIDLDDTADTDAAAEWATEQAVRFITVFDARMRERAKALRALHESDPMSNEDVEVEPEEVS